MGVGEDKIVKNQFIDKVHGNKGVNLNLISEVNPYLEDLVIECVNREGGYSFIGGEYRKNFFLSERDEKTSVYTSAASKKRIMDLSVSGLRLYVWMVYTVKRSQDKYWLNTKQFMREAGVSLNTMKAGIKELIDKDIIRPTSYKFTYFLNPALFFKGNRITEYENKVVVNDSMVTAERLGKSNHSFLGNGGSEGMSSEDFEKSIDDIFG